MKVKIWSSAQASPGDLQAPKLEPVVNYIMRYMGLSSQAYAQYIGIMHFLPSFYHANHLMLGPFYLSARVPPSDSAE